MFNDVVDHNTLSKLPFFGICSLSVSEASDLIVLDMWYSGELKNDILSKFKEPPLVADIKSALSIDIDHWQLRLAKAILSGSLKPELLSVDVDENVISCKTFVGDKALYEWLELHGYLPGDYFTDEYQLLRNDMYMYLLDVAYKVRNSRAFGVEILEKLISDRFDPGGNYPDKGEELLGFPTIENALPSIIKQITMTQHLPVTAETSSRETPDRPLPTRTKRTMLTIIASLCEIAKIDHQERGASARIEAAAHRLGAPITAETIKKSLDAIPEALEARIK